MNEQELLEKYAEKTSGFNLETFTPLVGETFIYQDPSGKLYELTLSSAKEGNNRDMFDSFTLTFTSPPNQLFPQGHYLLEHKSLGELLLFLVPTLSLDQQHNTSCAYFTRKKISPESSGN